MLHFLLLFLLPINSNCHTHWTCPLPRSDSPGIKAGPCGLPSDGALTDGTVTTLRPGPLTVSWEEVIIHHGAPFRIALGMENEDSGFEHCVLLDHIPHNDAGVSPQHYEITLTVPDVKCDRCTLQIIEFMTDKIETETCTYDPTCTTCSLNNTCFSNYHSCANIIIDGSVDRAEWVCQQPQSWPFSANPLVYGQESGEWTKDGRLGDSRVPDMFTDHFSCTDFLEVCEMDNTTDQVDWKEGDWSSCIDEERSRAISCEIVTSSEPFTDPKIVSDQCCYEKLQTGKPLAIEACEIELTLTSDEKRDLLYAGIGTFTGVLIGIIVFYFANRHFQRKRQLQLQKASLDILTSDDSDLSPSDLSMSRAQQDISDQSRALLSPVASTDLADRQSHDPRLVQSEDSSHDRRVLQHEERKLLSDN